MTAIETYSAVISQVVTVVWKPTQGWMISDTLSQVWRSARLSAGGLGSPASAFSTWPAGASWAPKGQVGT